MPRRDGALVLLLGALIFLPGLGLTDLWNPDEPRYAEVAREMLLGGEPRDFLLPHLNGEVYAEKPPLFFWTICLAAGLLGELDAAAARLPTALAATLTLLLIFDLGMRLLGRRAAWMAVAVFATGVHMMMQARSAQIDMLLVFLVTLAMDFWVRGFLDGRRAWFRLFFACCGLATLAKGPAGLLPPLLSVLAFLVASGRRDLIASMRPVRGLAVWAAVVLCWLLPAGWYGGAEYLREILLRQNLERFADPWMHVRPFYYYLQILPSNFFPWSFLLPTALIYGWRELRGAPRDGWRFALCWMVVTIVFFSLSPGKRTVYVLTMYPAMALLIGAGLGRLTREATTSRGWMVWPLALLAGIALAAAVGLPFWLGSRPELAVLGPRFPWLAGAALGLLAASAGAALRQAWKRRVMRAFTVLAAGSAAFGLLVVLVLRPPFDALKSARGLSRTLVDRAAPHEPYGIYPRLDPAFVFYSGRFAQVLETEERLRAFLDTPGRVWLLVKRGDLEAFDPPLAAAEVARDDDAYAGYVLLVSR